MLPLDVWQFCIIDYLKHYEQCLLIEHIPGLEPTNLLGQRGLTDTILKKYRYVKYLDVSHNENITYEGIKHLPLHTLYANGQNCRIKDEHIKLMSLNVLHGIHNFNITVEGSTTSDIEFIYL